MIRVIAAIVLILNCFAPLNAQNLTGTWSGTMDGHERIHVYIEMKRNELCGYSWDYALNDESSFCKAVFKGWFDPETKMWMLKGTHFMENSGSHILMLLRLKANRAEPDKMSGTVETAGQMSIPGIGRGQIQLRRVSRNLPADMPDCFPKITKPTAPGGKREAVIKPLPKHINPHVKKAAPPAKPTVKSKPRPKPPVQPKPTIAKKPAPKPKVDTLKKSETVVASAVKPPKAPEALLKKLAARKKTEFSRLVVHDRKVRLKLYDNGVVDNDTVSIFYNGRLLAGKRGLSVEPLELILQLDEDTDTHELTMYAENLGSIPPNTALVVVTTTDKRYELHSSASLTENAVLTFEYRPRVE